jgi:hypothetical protein
LTSDFEIRMFGWNKKKEDEKEKQLKQFKYAFPSLRRPNNDDTLYEIRFLVENQHNALRIAIPNEFPSVKPGNSKDQTSYPFLFISDF